MLPISSVASASFQYQCGFAETSAFTVVMKEALSLHGMFVGRSIRRTLRKMAVEISSAASELGSVQAFETWRFPIFSGIKNAAPL